MTSTEMNGYAAFGEEMGARGVLQGGERLRPTTDATTVRVRDGEVLTSDGPFAETKEQMGGFYLVDCADLDEAIEVASKIPGAQHRLDRSAADLGHVAPDVEAAVADAFREEWGRVVATLIRFTGDWDLAEECAQDAFTRALERWPRDGIPRNPGAWLTTTTRNRALDRLRRVATGAAKLQEVAVLSTPDEPSDDDERCRRRSPPADLHLLSPGARARGAGRAHAAHARRPHHRRDRARVPGARAHDGAAPRARRSARSATRASRTACRRRTCCRSAPARCWRCSTCCSTRGTRPRAAPTSCARDCAPTPSASPRTLAELMPDEPEAVGLLALMLLHDARRAGARRRHRRAGVARRTGPLDVGPGRHRRRGRAARGGAAATRAGPVSGAGGHRRVPRHRARRAARPTGWRSPRSTASWRAWCRRRSSS